MSTQLREAPFLRDPSADGGKNRVVCVQVTQTNQTVTAQNPFGVGHVQFTCEEAALMAAELLRFACGTEVEGS